MHCRKAFSIIILLITVSARSFCQDDSLVYVDDYKYYDLDTKFYISVSPLGFIDYKDGSSIRFSADARIFKHVALSTEAGFYTSFANVFSYKTSPKGFLIKPCLKIILNNVGFFNHAYIGLEYQYKQQTYREDDSIAIRGTTPYHKAYGMSRYINCINLKYGELYYLSNRILVEVIGGAGIRYFNSSTDLSQSEYNGILRGESHYNSTGGGYSARVIGRHVYPNVTIGAKLGVRL